MSVTNYKVNETQDLGQIFLPLSFGSSYPTETGYKDPNGKDLNTIFAAYPGYGTKANTTGYQVASIDLCDIFQKYDVSFSINNTNQSNISVTSTTQNGYNIYTFRTVSEVGSKNVWSPGKCTITFSINANISVILVGGGGAGGWSSNTYSGGGGGGGNLILQTANVKSGLEYSLQVGSGGAYYINGNQNGQSSSLIGDIVNLTATGGNQGANANTTNSNGVGGTSSNGGSGGNGGNPGIKGSDGSYKSYTTGYGSTLQIGGGGGGGSKSSSSSFIGYGYRGNNGIGGAAGNSSSTSAQAGLGFGAGGGGGPGITTSGSSTASGGAGYSGLVIIYFK